MASKSPPDARECDPSLHFDVDCLILDYLVYNATQSVLTHARSRSSAWRAPTRNASGKIKEEKLPFEIDNVLHMVDAFLRIFTSSHSMIDAPASLRFRLRLLQFASLFMFRNSINVTTPSKVELISQRKRNAQRARTWLARWLERAADGTSPRGRKDCFHAHELTSATNDDIGDHEISLPTILDMLPLFVELTAARSNEGEYPISDAWLQLAAEMMLQGLLEQYLVCGCVCFEPVHQAFAWGFEGMEGLQPAVQINEEGDAETGHIAAEPNAEEANTLELTSTGFLSDSIELDGRSNIVFCNVEQTDPHPDLPPDSVLQLRSNPSWIRIRDECNKVLLEPAELTGTLNALEWAHECSSVEAGYDEIDSIITNCRTAATAHPIEPFNARMLGFLEDLSGSVAQPILTQLERASDDEAVLELNIDFERVRITGDEAAELRKLAGEIRGVK